MTDEPTDDVPDDGIHLDAPPPPDGALDRARDAAMAAFDEHHATRSSAARVDDLAAARARRAWYQRVPLGAVAAALIVIALVGVFALTDLGTGIDEMATAGDDDSAESAEAEREQDSATADDGDAGSAGGTTSDDAAADLDSTSNQQTYQRTATYDDADDLIDDLRDRFGPTAASGESGDWDDLSDQSESAPTSTTTAPAAGARCDALAASGVDPADALAIVPATIGGRPVTAVVYPASDGLRVSLVATTSCSVDDDRPL